MHLNFIECEGTVAPYGSLSVEEVREETKEEVVEILRKCDHLIDRAVMNYLISQIRGAANEHN